MTKVLVLYYSAYGHIETMANAVAGRVVDAAYEGDRSLYRVATDAGRVLLVSTANVARTAQTFRSGQSVWLGWAADAGHELDE